MRTKTNQPNRSQRSEPADRPRPKVWRHWSNSRAFTLIEALVAVGVLAVGIVGLQAAMRRGLVSSVKAWDRAYKTNLAISRLEEHKAQLFGEYVPGMQLPIVEAVPRPNGTPGVDFQGNTLTYGADVKVLIDAENNIITTQPGYGVVLSLPVGPGTPTQVLTPTHYYGSVGSPTPYVPALGTPTPSTGYAWIHPNPPDLCNPSLGNIYFDITTPPNINGTVAMAFSDYQQAQRSQSVWFGTFQKAIFGAGQIPGPTAVPTIVSFPITRFDTIPTPSSGVLKFRVKQEGNPAVWGIPLEDGTNQVNFTVQCGPTAPPTPTSTGTPSALCTDGNCTQVDAYNDATTSGNGSFDSSTSGPNHIRPEGSGGWARYVYFVPCTGNFKVQANVCTNDDAGENNNIKVTLTGSGVSPVWTPTSDGVTAIWYPDPNGAVCDDYDPMDVRHGGTNYGNATEIPALWAITASGNVTLTFYTGNINFYPRINWFCLTRTRDLGTAPPAPPTATPTAIPLAVYHIEADPGSESGNISQNTSGGITYIYNTSSDTSSPPNSYKDFVVTVGCGTYKMPARVYAPGGSNDSWFVEILGRTDTSGGATEDVFGIDPDNSTWTTLDVNEGNGGAVRYWDLPAGAVTVRWGGRETNARLDWFELQQTGTFGSCPTNTPTWTPTVGNTSTFTNTPTNTPSPTITPTPTPTSVFICTFPAQPTPRSQSGLSPNYAATPGWGQFGCDNQLGIGSFLALEGQVDDTKSVRLYSGPMAEGPLDSAGIVEARVFIRTASSVTLRVVGVQPTPGVPVTYTGTYTHAGPAAWQAVTVSGLAAGTTITGMSMEFTGSGLTTGVTNYLGVDSIRVIYDTVLNPNAVLTWASFSAMDFKRDIWTHRPNFIVDSYVQPMEAVGSAKGYQVKIIVHNGRYLGMVTPTPGTGVNQATPVPYGLPNNKFPPVTIINSISP